ncbi:hypothetical protein QBC41DRAFT_150221 [Cercophora samala]|uniref:Transmembrane protein n=1 Tax=Cercophora samala TaxID=330535 RepID=A0AA40D7T3_9PEZI|nr:hypothetical protein QBC41DRAFT_150221 [Cercophora samala]
MGDSNDDINIASGTCYWGPGEEAHPDFIPCGNAAFGHVQCCGKGAVCFAEGHTCFSWGGTITYMAGCTDSAYEDSSCPDKKIYSDQPWMGMVFCKDTVDKDGRGLWAGCAEKGKPRALRTNSREPDNACNCTAEPSSAIESRVVLKAKNQIGGRFASLPGNLGESIQWMDNFVPTGTLTAEELTITTSDLLSTTIASDLSSATFSNTDADSAVAPSITTTNNFQTLPSATETPVAPVTSGGLGTPAKVGIAFGAVVGLMLILGALFAIRTLRHPRQVDDSSSGADHGEHGTGTKGEEAAELATETSPVVGELPTDTKARPETLRSELAASSPTSPHSSRLSELPDHGMWGPAMHPQVYPIGMSPPHAYSPALPSHGYPTGSPAQGSYSTSFPQQGYSVSYPQQGYLTSVSPELGLHPAHFRQNIGHEEDKVNEGQQRGATELSS